MNELELWLFSINCGYSPWLFMTTSGNLSHSYGKWPSCSWICWYIHSKSGDFTWLCKLLGGLDHFWFSHIFGMSSSQLTNSYFGGWNHQPVLPFTRGYSLHIPPSLGAPGQASARCLDAILRVRLRFYEAAEKQDLQRSGDTPGLTPSTQQRVGMVMYSSIYLR